MLNNPNSDVTFVSWNFKFPVYFRIAPDYKHVKAGSVYEWIKVVCMVMDNKYVIQVREWI